MPLYSILSLGGINVGSSGGLSVCLSELNDGYAPLRRLNVGSSVGLNVGLNVGMNVGCSSSNVFRLLSSVNPPMASKILCKSSSLDPPELSPTSSRSLLPSSVGLKVGLNVGLVSSNARASLSPPPPPQSALALSQSNPASSANSQFSLHTSHAIQSYAFET